MDMFPTSLVFYPRIDVPPNRVFPHDYNGIHDQPYCTLVRRIFVSISNCKQTFVVPLVKLRLLWKLSQTSVPSWVHSSRPLPIQLQGLVQNSHSRLSLKL
jgi:hypothetical protein